MKSLEKFKRLLELNDKVAKVKITTTDSDIYYCVVDSPAEGEDDWAYHFISPDYPTKYFILECDFIEQIEEISEEEWQRHLEQAKKSTNKQRTDKFTWQPADVKVQDENGNWIRGDEFLRQKKPHRSDA